MRPKQFIGDLFPALRWYFLLGGCAGLYLLAFFVPVLYLPANLITGGMLMLTFADYALLFFSRGRVIAERMAPPRFSLGDKNRLEIRLSNQYPFPVTVNLIDELPEQFQVRDFNIRTKVSAGEHTKVNYAARPVTRGEYHFGEVICYAASPLGLMRRRFRSGTAQIIKVYPSFQHLRKYQLMAFTENPAAGAKKVRRLGHSMEFEKIKDYVQGDDVRTINWKASARRGDLMVNTYTDARQQLVYCLIDKGRAMKMPFDGMTLLDYSINAALAVLNVALLRQDRAGIITFSQKVNDVIAADRRSSQMNTILEGLYRQQTDFKESDYQALWTGTHRQLSQRCFLLLFTNFETMSALERQLPYLRRLAQRHLLCVVFFQNTLLKEIHEREPDTVEGIYIKTIADRFDFEKRQIVRELRRHGILSILTTPQSLSVDVINKYLELKAQQMI